MAFTELDLLHSDNLIYCCVGSDAVDFLRLFFGGEDVLGAPTVGLNKC